MNFLALTPNPALDLSGHVAGLVPNEKNYVFKPRLDPGGNSINAARIVQRLGGTVTNLGFAGGAAGRQLEELLKAESLPSSFVRIAQSTRTNVTVTNDSDGQQTRLTFPGPLISSAELKALEKKLAARRAPGILAIGGSIPPGLPDDFVTRITRRASKAGFGVSLDVPSIYLKQALRQAKQRFLLLKPNLTELTELTGQALGSPEAIKAAANRLVPKAGLVCVSLGRHGAILVADKRSWLARPPKVKTRGSVGAGDSMVGAMCWRLMYHGLTLPDQIAQASSSQLADVLAWGLAAGAATASTEGTVLGSAKRIRQLRRLVRQHEEKTR